MLHKDTGSTVSITCDRAKRGDEIPSRVKRSAEVKRALSACRWAESSQRHNSQQPVAATHAGRPLLLRVYVMSAARSRSSRGPMSSRPRQKWRSLPPCSGRPSVGSGDGSSMRWIISATQPQPKIAHAHRSSNVYGERFLPAVEGTGAECAGCAGQARGQGFEQRAGETQRAHQSQRLATRRRRATCHPAVCGSTPDLLAGNTRLTPAHGQYNGARLSRYASDNCVKMRSPCP